MSRTGNPFATASLVTLAVLGVIAALYLMKLILVPIALAVLLACLLSPVKAAVRDTFHLGPTGAAVFLFVLATLIGLYITSLMAASMVEATYTLPADLERVAGQLSRSMTQTIRDKPYLRGVIPEPRTIDELGDANRTLLYDRLSLGLSDLMGSVAQGFVVLILVLFLLAESEMLAAKLVRFFAKTNDDALKAEATLNDLTRQIRGFLAARTLINLGVGVAFAAALWLKGVKFPFVLGLLAAVMNFIPYVGQVIGGGVPMLVALGESGQVGDALIVASIYLAIVGVEGYVVTPWVLGRSLDLNGTTILIACLFWGFLWGLVGLILAMPLTVCVKLVFQNVPELHRWADLMSQTWQPPASPVPPGPPVAEAEDDSTEIEAPARPHAAPSHAESSRVGSDAT